MNDEKIPALGRYVSNKLSNGLAKALGIDENTAEMAWVFGWETAHRSDKCRVVKPVFSMTYLITSKSCVFWSTNLGLYSALTDLTHHRYAIFAR